MLQITFFHFFQGNSFQHFTKCHALLPQQIYISNKNILDNDDIGDNDEFAFNMGQPNWVIWVTTVY